MHSSKSECCCITPFLPKQRSLKIHGYAALTVIWRGFAASTFGSVNDGLLVHFALDGDQRK